jgi:protein-tyrosine phosphatase
MKAPPMPAKSPHHRILFVCLGNICRSPAAEIILQKIVDDAGLAHQYKIDSAGIIGHHTNSPPDSRMAASLKQQGFNIHGRARQITAGDLKEFDQIITMDESNLADAKKLDPTGTLHRKIQAFVSFCRFNHDPRVPDPYYGGQRGFDHVIEMLKDGCEGILESCIKNSLPAEPAPSNPQTDLTDEGEPPFPTQARRR